MFAVRRQMKYGDNSPSDVEEKWGRWTKFLENLSWNSRQNTEIVHSGTPEKI